MTSWTELWTATVLEERSKCKERAFSSDIRVLVGRGEAFLLGWLGRLYE